MNIFVLDLCPKTAAKYACNQHVNKMISEAALMLSAAHWVHDGTLTQHGWWHPRVDYFTNLSRPAYLNHPCTKWVARSKGNYSWTFQWFQALAEEYWDWKKKEHAAYGVRKNFLRWYPNKMTVEDCTLTKADFPQCMPDAYKVQGDAVAAYRKFYIHDKARFATWGDRPVPEWYLVATNK